MHFSETAHARCSFPHGDRRLFRPGRAVRARLRSSVAEAPMTFELILGAIVAAGLFVYLSYALVRPERF